MNAHVFKISSQAAQNTMACKVIPATNLVGFADGDDRWRAEFTKANSIDLDMVVKVHAVEVADAPDSKERCAFLSMPFIKGVRLEERIKQGSIDMAFIESFLSEMLEFLYETTRRGISHGDLHQGNLMVADRGSRIGVDKYAFRILDFGVACSSLNVVPSDDFSSVGKLLREMLSTIDYRTLETSRERFLFRELCDNFVSVYLTEHDPTRDPHARDAEKIYNELQGVDARLAAVKASGASQIQSPFEYLSLEQMGESHELLRALYSDKFLCLGQIEERKNVVLTGPRGCGKSTVFKSLSTAHRMFGGGELELNAKYFSVYYRCDDIYDFFPRYVAPEREEAVDLPVHFLSCSLASELLSTIRSWFLKYEPDEFLRNESLLASDIWKCLEMDPPSSPEANSFNALITRLRRERIRAADKQRVCHDKKQSFGQYLRPSSLPKVCSSIVRSMPAVNSRPFFFFIDDYSSPRITFALQQSLNRLLMGRWENCFFKLSTESPVSFTHSDCDGKQFVESREFDLINLGEVFLYQSSPDERQRFIDDIFNRRFRAVDSFPARDLIELLGDPVLPTGSEMADSFRNGKKVILSGRKLLGYLCSGDVFYLLSLVGRMVRTSGGVEGLLGKAEFPMVDATSQYKAVRAEAGAFIESLRSIEGGDHLVKIITAFGNVANYLLKKKNSKNESGSPAWQASRIEPYEPLNLTPDEREVYESLLRYSVFVEDHRGKSRRGKVVPRLSLRRSLLPHLKLTFNKRDAVSLGPEDVRQLLNDPDAFEVEQKRKIDLGIDMDFTGFDGSTQESIDFEGE